MNWLKWKGFNSFCCHLCSFRNFLGNSIYKVLTFVRLVFTAAELNFSNSLLILHFTPQTYMSECQNLMFVDIVSLLNRFQKELDQNRLLWLFGKMYETENFGQMLSNLRCLVSSKGSRKPCQNAKFTGKHLCWSLFFNKVANLRPTTLLKMRL